MYPVVDELSVGPPVASSYSVWLDFLMEFADSEFGLHTQMRHLEKTVEVVERKLA